MAIDTNPSPARPSDKEPAALRYERDPEAITRASFAIVEREAGLGRLPLGIRALARRLVHSCGMPEIVDDLAWQGEPERAGMAALASARLIFVDARMVEAGIMASLVPQAVEIVCTLGDPRVPGLAREHGTTRSAAAVELWAPRLEGAIVAIGNAPTALFRLIELLLDGGSRPAVILAFPVGFVGAAESKEALIDARLGVPFLTLRGRRGGSAMAAAAVNALLTSSDPLYG
jgi:precorrin-8X/cobalt-precorrin-8 methylmutase